MRIIKVKSLEKVYEICVKRTASYTGNGYSWVSGYGLAPYVFHPVTRERLVLVVNQ